MQPTAKIVCSQAFQFWMLIYSACAIYSQKALPSNLSLWDAYSQSICSLQPKSYVAPFICGCLFTKHMQPTAQKLCQAFYLWTLIHTAYAAYSPEALSSLSLVDAYSQSQSIYTYSQSMCGLQPKSSVKPFTWGCLFTKPKHVQPTAQKLFSQTFRLNWNITSSHKAQLEVLSTAWSPKHGLKS